jgi:diamine N-acetyltransferase
MSENLQLSAWCSSKLVGQRLNLVRTTERHAAFLQSCYLNTTFMSLYRLLHHSQQQPSLPQIAQRLAAETQLPPHYFEWIIERHSDGQPIGLASLADYQPNHGRAEFLIGLLNPAEHPIGMGLEASLLVLEFAFNTLQLHKLSALVYSHNIQAQRNVLHLGFHSEGLLREHLQHKQQWVDIHQNSLLEREFRASTTLRHCSIRLLKRDITELSVMPLSEATLRQAKTALLKMLMPPASL